MTGGQLLQRRNRSGHQSLFTLCRREDLEHGGFSKMLSECVKSLYYSSILFVSVCPISGGVGGWGWE